MPDFGLNDDGSSLFDPGFQIGADGNLTITSPNTGNTDPSGGSVFTLPDGTQVDLSGSGDNVNYNPSIPDGTLAGGSSGNDWASAFLKMLGFGSGGGNTAGGLATILSLLGIGGSALLGSNASKQGAADISAAVTGANNAATNVFSQQGALYKPYYDAGVSAVNRMAGQAPSNLAGNFNPLGTGRGIKLGTLAGQ